MKKSFIILILIFLLCSCTLTVGACFNLKLSKSVTGISVALKPEFEATQGEFAYGKFDYYKYDVTITYDNGSKKVVSLTEDMIPTKEKLKFWQYGEQNVEVSYMGCTATLTCYCQLYDLSVIELLPINETYTGQAYTLQFNSDIPSDVEVEYVDGYEFTDAMHKRVSVVLSGMGYARTVLYTEVNIGYAEYNIDDFVFADKTVNYDGLEHVFEGEGTLPDGVSVEYYTLTYEGEVVTQSVRQNTFTEIGTYAVQARFACENPNYKPIQSQIAWFTVGEMFVGIDAVKQDLLSQTSNLILYDNTDKRITLSPTAQVPVQLDVDKFVYTYYVLDGETWNKLPDGQPIIDAGNYAVEVSNFVAKEDYQGQVKADEQAIRIEYQVRKSVYSPKFVATAFVYDGEAKHLVLDETTFPINCDTQIESCKYVQNGIEVANPKLAGVYNAELTFKQPKNYVIEKAYVALTISPASLTVSQIEPMDLSYSEDGQVHYDYLYIREQVMNTFPDYLKPYISLTVLFPKDGTGKPMTELKNVGEYSLDIVLNSNDLKSLVISGDTNLVKLSVSVVNNETYDVKVIRNDLLNMDKYKNLVYDETLRFTVEEFQNFVDSYLKRDAKYGITCTVNMYDANGILINDGVISGAGDYTVKMNFAGSDNWKPSLNTISFDLKIAKAQFDNKVAHQLFDDITFTYKQNTLKSVLESFMSTAREYDPSMDLSQLRVLSYSDNVYTQMDINSILSGSAGVKPMTYVVRLEEFDSNNYVYDGNIRKTVTINKYKVVLNNISGNNTILKVTYESNKSWEVKYIQDQINGELKKVLPECDLNATVTLYSNSVETTSVTNAGTYSCKVHFGMSDYYAYDSNTELVDATFIVNKATLDLSKIIPSSSKDSPIAVFTRSEILLRKGGVMDKLRNYFNALLPSSDSSFSFSCNYGAMTTDNDVYELFENFDITVVQITLRLNNNGNYNNVNDYTVWIAHVR